MSEHRCQPPTIAATSLTHPLQPDWTCGVCGRVWRDWAAGALRFWAEIRGPRLDQESQR